LEKAGKIASALPPPSIGCKCSGLFPKSHVTVALSSTLSALTCALLKKNKSSNSTNVLLLRLSWASAAGSRALLDLKCYFSVFFSVAHPPSWNRLNNANFRSFFPLVPLPPPWKIFCRGPWRLFHFKLFTRASAEKFPGEEPTKKYRKIALFFRGWGGATVRPKSSKKRPKILLLSLDILYLYHV